MKQQSWKMYAMLLMLPLLIGVGCNSNSQEPDKKVTQVFKQPESVKNPLTEAYAYCEQGGNKTIVQYDAKSRESKVYCVFPNNAQCDAIAYLQGACSKSNGAKVFDQRALTDTQILRSCGTSDPAVCGIDGRNYSNYCIAALQNVAVLHEGVCTKDSSSLKQRSTVVSNQQMLNSSNNTTGDTPNDTSSNSIGPTISQQSTNWLNMIIGLATSNPATSPRTKISSCTIDNQTFYHLTQGNPDNFSVLYDENGDTHCFPSHDVTGVCPENFSPNGCREIWRDRR